ncbi:MAG: hypothetical protein V1816_18715 [Pseudomonadota bacterium]
MEIGSQGTTAAGLAVGGMVKSLQAEALKGQVIEKTLKASEQQQALQKGETGFDFQKNLLNAVGVGLKIDAIV